MHFPSCPQSQKTAVTGISKNILSYETVTEKTEGRAGWHRAEQLEGSNSMNNTASKNREKLIPDSLTLKDRYRSLI